MFLTISFIRITIILPILIFNIMVSIISFMKPIIIETVLSVHQM